MIHSRVKFDTTSFASLLSSDAGYKYQIYGWAMHNNGSSYSEMNTGINIVIVTGNTNLYGTYNSGAGALSYAGVWQLPIQENPYFEVPEGKNLLISIQGIRVSGTLWYEKVSTAAATTTPLRMLMGMGI
ncbi:hypothetical protein M0R04_10675 [Candidatus Dojkabacteria bacterium]|jgi:hypothetical protein|nr:hypothetical protein [Candidatus Dojkabacteria bacterium]